MRTCFPLKWVFSNLLLTEAALTALETEVLYLSTEQTLQHGQRQCQLRPHCPSASGRQPRLGGATSKGERGSSVSAPTPLSITLRPAGKGPTPRSVRVLVRMCVPLAAAWAPPPQPACDLQLISSSSDGFRRSPPSLATTQPSPPTSH